MNTRTSIESYSDTFQGVFTIQQVGHVIEKKVRNQARTGRNFTEQYYDVSENKITAIVCILEKACFPKASYASLK